MEQPAPRVPEGTVRNGVLEVDLNRLLVCVEGTTIRMSSLEMALLVQLAREAGHVVSRERLRATIWREDADRRALRPVDVLVHRLRRRLGAAGRLVQSVRSHGYLLRSAPL